MLFNLLQAAVDTTAYAPAAAASQEMNFSLIEMATKGGWLMIVLLVLSIMAIYIFGNKWWLIYKAGQIDKNFMNDIRDMIHDGKIKEAVRVLLHSFYTVHVVNSVHIGLLRVPTNM